MLKMLGSACRVCLGWMVSTALGWFAGQWLQDLLAPDLARPTVNDGRKVSEYLSSLPPLAHGARLLAMGLGIVLGTYLVRRMPGNLPNEAWVLTFLLAAGTVFDVLRVDHGPALSIATVSLVLPCAWMGMALASRQRP